MPAVLENFHVLSMPAYWILCLLPHAYAIHLGSGGKALRWDNRNPRGSAIKNNMKSRLSPEVFAQYERAEAASANAFENMPLYYGAVIIGKMAGLDKQILDKFALSFLLARTAHSLSYVFISNQKYTYLRTLLYFCSSGLCINVYLKAARTMK